MIEWLVFDVNETLLDITVLKPALRRALGANASVREWYLETLQYALVMNETGRYAGFGELGRAVLEMTAAGRGHALVPERTDEFLQKMDALPPYPDVIPGLSQLRASGYRLATLTNSTEESMTKKLTQSGLQPLFERTLSIEAVRKAKPAAETYRFAAKSLHAAPEEMLMVASHPWDIGGAMQTGMLGALILRQDKALFPLLPKPTYTAPDLLALSRQLGGTAPRR